MTHNIEIQMKRKEPTKYFMMISNWKTLWSPYSKKYFSAVRVKGTLYVISTQTRHIPDECTQIGFFRHFFPFLLSVNLPQYVCKLGTHTMSEWVRVYLPCVSFDCQAARVWEDDVGPRGPSSPTKVARSPSAAAWYLDRGRVTSTSGPFTLHPEARLQHC